MIGIKEILFTKVCRTVEVISCYCFQNLGKMKESHSQVLDNMEKLNEKLKEVKYNPNKACCTRSNMTWEISLETKCSVRRFDSSTSVFFDAGASQVYYVSKWVKKQWCDIKDTCRGTKEQKKDDYSY